MEDCQGIAAEYISGGADIGSGSPMALSSTPRRARPEAMDVFLLIAPSIPGWGLDHPVSILNIWSDDLGGTEVYTMPLSSARECISEKSCLPVPLDAPLLSDFGLPALLDGEYRQSMPQARQREHIGLAFEHLTLAKKQPSHEARSRGWRVLPEEAIKVMR